MVRKGTKIKKFQGSSSKGVTRVNLPKEKKGTCPKYKMENRRAKTPSEGGRANGFERTTSLSGEGRTPGLTSVCRRGNSKGQREGDQQEHWKKGIYC